MSLIGLCFANGRFKYASHSAPFADSIGASISFSPLLPVAVDLPMSPKAKNTVNPAIINANKSIATDFFTELLWECNWVN